MTISKSPVGDGRWGFLAWWCVGLGMKGEGASNAGQIDFGDHPLAPGRVIGHFHGYLARL